MANSLCNKELVDQPSSVLNELWQENLTKCTDISAYPTGTGMTCYFRMK